MIKIKVYKFIKVTIFENIKSIINLVRKSFEDHYDNLRVCSVNLSIETKRITNQEFWQLSFCDSDSH